jgi:hypothetical protein
VKLKQIFEQSNVISETNAFFKVLTSATGTAIDRHAGLNARRSGSHFGYGEAPELGAHFSFSRRTRGPRIQPFANAQVWIALIRRVLLNCGRTPAYDASELEHIKTQWAKDKSLLRRTQMIPSLAPGPGAPF